ncbi:MAG: M48 family metalloprotease [Deltaproteobacteria bacterium]|nr:M48 family metalloprotease [Deltaproteobacteria bacterium]
MSYADLPSVGLKFPAAYRRAGRRGIASLLLLSSLFVTGCSTVSVEHENEAAIATTRWLDRKVGFVEDREVAVLMHRVMERLKGAVYKSALEADLDRSDADKYKDYPWQILVLKSDKANAFNPGAGVVFLSLGMIRELKTEAELAAVVSHEMAHQLLGHTREALAEAGSSDSPQFAFTLQHEIEADALGLKILSVARYTPNASIDAITDTTRARGIGTLDDESVKERLSLLRQAINRMTPPYPATDNTREYAALRDELRS